MKFLLSLLVFVRSARKKHAELKLKINYKIELFDIIEMKKNYKEDSECLHIVFYDDRLEFRDAYQGDEIVYKIGIENNNFDDMITNCLYKILSFFHIDKTKYILLDDRKCQTKYLSDNIMNTLKMIPIIKKSKILTLFSDDEERVSISTMTRSIYLTRLLNFIWNLGCSRYSGIIKNREGFDFKNMSFIDFLDSKSSVDCLIEFLEKILIKMNLYILFQRCNESAPGRFHKNILSEIFKLDILPKDKLINLVDYIFNKNTHDDVYSSENVRTNLKILDSLVITNNIKLLDFFLLDKNYEDAVLVSNDQQMSNDIIFEVGENEYVFIKTLNYLSENTKLTNNIYYKELQNIRANNYDYRINSDEKVILDKYSFSIFYDEYNLVIGNERLSWNLQIFNNENIFEIKSFVDFLETITISEYMSFDNILEIESDMIDVIFADSHNDVILKSLMQIINYTSILSINKNVEYFNLINNLNYEFNSEFQRSFIISKSRYLKDTCVCKYLVCWLYYKMLSNDKYSKYLRSLIKSKKRCTLLCDNNIRSTFKYCNLEFSEDYISVFIHNYVICKSMIDKLRFWVVNRFETNDKVIFVNENIVLTDEELKLHGIL